MIVSKDFMEEIKNNFNLNIYEVKIWTALLSRGVAAAGELSEISNVPRSRAYDVLESLERKGFIIMKVGRPIKYIAVAPNEIMSRVKKQIDVDKEYKIGSIEKLKDTDMFAELEELHRAGIDKVDMSDLSGTLHGRNTVYSFLKNSIDSATKSIILATGKEGLVRKMSFLRGNITKAVKRGVKVKIHSTSNDLPTDLRKMEFKKTDVHSRFVLVDNSTLVFMLQNDDKSLHPSYDSAVWVKSPYFIDTMNKLIN